MQVHNFLRMLQVNNLAQFTLPQQGQDRLHFRNNPTLQLVWVRKEKLSRSDQLNYKKPRLLPNSVPDLKLTSTSSQHGWWQPCQRVVVNQAYLGRLQFLHCRTQEHLAWGHIIKPNGLLALTHIHPFQTSQLQVWVEQLALQDLRRKPQVRLRRQHGQGRITKCTRYLLQAPRSLLTEHPASKES